MTNHGSGHHAASGLGGEDLPCDHTEDPRNPLGNWDWDERYSASDRIWSGQPNNTLVTETTGLAPGRAVDVGCGEGADAVWLARHGWRVTALDVSEVALSRAGQAAKDAGVEVEWVHAGLVDADLTPGAFDLVSVHYPALLKTSGQNTERVLLALVAPGGTLLAVYHADMDAAHCREHGVDPDAFVWPGDVVAALDETWEVHVDERRPRQVPAGGDARHNFDFVIRARRRPDPATSGP